MLKVKRKCFPFSLSVVAWKSQMVRMEVQAGIYTTSNIWKLSQNFKHHEKCNPLIALAVIWLLVCYMTGKITNEGALIFCIYLFSVWIYREFRPPLEPQWPITCMELIFKLTSSFHWKIKKKNLLFFFLTHARSCWPELSNFSEKKPKNRPVCKNVVT